MVAAVEVGQNGEAAFASLREPDGRDANRS